MDSSARLLEKLTDGLSSRYRIERELGRGGMATVFLARDVAHDRPVAIKVLLPEIAAGFSVARFLREIRLLAALQHPNILPLHDSGTVADLPYYVMPFVAGESLRDRLERENTLPVDLAVRMTCEAAAALDYAHRQGVVHRDIKPENILLSDEHVIVADFGIARAAQQSADDKITGTSVVVGTPAYMSPEQASGEPVIDGRSDIYALACVLFEALAGRQPFTGATASAVIASRFAKPAPRLSEIKPGIPAAIESAVAAALSLAADDRPQTASAFAGMLTAGGAAAASAQPRPNRKIPMLVGGIAIAAAALLYAIRPQERRDASATSSGTPPTLAARHVVDREAHDLYLQGRKSMEVPSTGIPRATELFLAAIKRDSLYAEAWSGLADTHSSRGVGNFESVLPRPEFEQARFAALRALQLDSTLAEAHAALALVQMMYDYDWKASWQSLDRAEHFDPGYATTYLYRSFLLTWLGKVDSASGVAREGLRMNPNDSRFRQEHSRTLVLGRKYSEAESILQRYVSTDQKNARLKMLLGEALLDVGKVAEGARQLDQAQAIAPVTTRITAFRVAAYARSGREKEARALVDSLVAASDQRFIQAMDLAIAYAGLKDADQTMLWLERSYTDRSLRPYLRDPVFDFVRSDSRYLALLKKLNLSP